MAFFTPPPCLSYNRVKGAERSVNTVKNAGEEQEIKPHVDRFLVSEKKGDILAGKPNVLAGTEVHDQAADNEQSGDGKSGKNAHLLRFKYVVNFFHGTYILKRKTSNVTIQAKRDSSNRQ